MINVLNDIESSIRGELIAYLSGFTLERRYNQFVKVLNNRTRYISVVLENVYQPQNASAVLRSCDCHGVQDIHIIEKDNSFLVDPNIDMGSSKWLTLHRYSSDTAGVLRVIKSRGYRIVATSPHKYDVDIRGLDLGRGPIALVFGTELTGLSEEALSMADEYVTIPMFGFTESFNISVSVALCLYELTHRLRKSNIQYGLTIEEQEQILLTWLRSSIRNSDLIIKRFIAEYGKKV